MILWKAKNIGRQGIVSRFSEFWRRTEKLGVFFQKTRRVFPENSARFSKNSARFSKNSACFSKNSACFSIPDCHNVMFRSASKTSNEVTRCLKRTSFVLLFLAQGIGVPPQGVLERSGRMKRKRKHGKPGFARNAGEMRPA